MSTPYYTTNFPNVYQYGQARIRYPIPQDTTAKIYDITFEGALASYPGYSLDDTIGTASTLR